MFRLFHVFAFVLCVLFYCFPYVFDFTFVHGPLSRKIIAFDTLSVCVAWDGSVRNLYALILLLNFIMPLAWVFKSGSSKVKPGIGLLIAAVFLFLYGLMQLYFGLPFGDMDGSAELFEYLYCNYKTFSFALIVITGMFPMMATFFFVHVMLSMAGRK
jgi:hypothetical protein